jgi:hypothetical protein
MSFIANKYCNKEQLAQKSNKYEQDDEEYIASTLHELKLCSLHDAYTVAEKIILHLNLKDRSE